MGEYQWNEVILSLTVGHFECRSFTPNRNMR